MEPETLQVLIAQSTSTPRGKGRGGARHLTHTSAAATSSIVGGASASGKCGEEGSGGSDESDSDSSYYDSNDSDDEASNSNGSGSGSHSNSTPVPQRGKQVNPPKSKPQVGCFKQTSVHYMYTRIDVTIYITRSKLKIALALEVINRGASPRQVCPPASSQSPRAGRGPR